MVMMVVMMVVRRRIWEAQAMPSITIIVHTTRE
jgi:hypothetical protein